MAPATAPQIPPGDLPPAWRVAFAIDAMLSVASAAPWMLDGEGYVRSPFGVAATSAE